MTVDDMTDQYVATLRDDREPTHRALAMTRAVLAHLEDLRDDDPGDHEAQVRPLLERAACKAVDLVDTLRRMLPIVAVTIIVHSSAPPLAPQDAARILRASKSIVDRTEPSTVREDGPRLVSIASKPQDGPFGPLKLSPMPPQPRFVHVHHVEPTINVRRVR